jgi:hypothetical protein
MATRQKRLSPSAKREVAAQIRVRCCGTIHRIALMRGGALCLLDHNGTEDIISALSDGGQCRCQEIRRAWIEQCTHRRYGVASHPSSKSPLKSLTDFAEEARTLSRSRDAKNSDLQEIAKARNYKLRENNIASLRCSLLARLRLRAYEVAQETLTHVTYAMPPGRAPEMPVITEHNKWCWHITESSAHSSEQAVMDETGCNILFIQRHLNVAYRPVHLLRAHMAGGCLARQENGTVIFVAGMYDQDNCMRLGFRPENGEIAVVCGRQLDDAVLSIQTAAAMLRQDADGVWHVSRWLPLPEETTYSDGHNDRDYPDHYED